MKPVNVGLCGLGTVGSGVVNVMQRNGEMLNRRVGREVQLVQIGARRDNPNCNTGSVSVVRDIFAVAENPQVDVLVELIGGCDVAKELVLKAIEHGKHVVTANKALIAEHGNEIFSAAEARGVTVAYEAAVAGGIPIIKAVREGLSANRIEFIAGIINGTGNYILSEMRDKGRLFAEVLQEAQQLGYAEADPTFDVEGIDAAHKLTILASIAFGIPLQFDRTYTEGISKITREDVTYAEELGYRIKHLGITQCTEQGVELRVHPTLVPEDKLLAKVDGVMNAVYVKADAVGPTLYYGPGAGAEPTASAVIADLVDLATAIDTQPQDRVAHMGFRANALSAAPVLDIEAVQSCYYLRMQALDKTGVLAKVATILSQRSINIEAIIQKEPKEGEQHVAIILLTQRVAERDINHAITEIEAVGEIQSQVTRIRVDHLD